MKSKAASESARTLASFRVPKPFTCVVCGTEAVSVGRPGRFCSNACKVRHYQEQRKIKQQAETAALQKEITRLNKQVKRLTAEVARARGQ